MPMANSLLWQHRECRSPLRHLLRDPCASLPGWQSTHLEPFQTQKFQVCAAGKSPFGPQNLESLVLCNEQQLSHRHIFRTTHHSSFTPSKRLAIKELQAPDQIIIKPADKGSAVVIWDRLDYLREGYRQLSDPKFYQTLDHNPTQSFSRLVSNTIEDMFQNGEIDNSVKDFLLEAICRTPECYLLHKIHKKNSLGTPLTSSKSWRTWGLYHPTACWRPSMLLASTKHWPLQWSRGSQRGPPPVQTRARPETK